MHWLVNSPNQRHQVGPRRRGGHEVKMKSLVALQPFLDVFVAVIAPIVQNDVYLAGRVPPLQVAHQAQEFLIGMARVAFADHVPGTYVIGGEQVRGAMPLVVVGTCSAFTLLPWQSRLGAV